MTLKLTEIQRRNLHVLKTEEHSRFYKLLSHLTQEILTLARDHNPARF